MIPAEIIKLKRSGQELSTEQIKEFVGGYVSGTIADYQMSAFLMAVYFQGMSKKETFALTKAMLHSGVVVDLSSIKARKIDKHSTGGVGDKTSLIVGPIVAAAGVAVPMISGRGLGHTGGTLDKLESMPGFNTQLSLEQFKKQVKELGICFIGQTKEICPADKKMYALRDVTATVECIPLICASIMSKKLAEGIDGLVLDVKVGSGAFMKTAKDARLLARNLIEIGTSAGKDVVAFITDMNQPLGNAIGNALEVQECFDVFDGKGPHDLTELSLKLSASMLILGKAAKTSAEAYDLAKKTLASGRARLLFEKMVITQGGSLQLPKALTTKTVISKKSGYISAMDVEKIGLASLALGAGRKKSDDLLDWSAGIVLHKKLGDKVNKGESVATFHYDGRTAIIEAEEMFLAALKFGSKKVKAPKLIIEILGSLSKARSKKR